jgi:hypothetical protein
VQEGERENRHRDVEFDSPTPSNVLARARRDDLDGSISSLERIAIDPRASIDHLARIDRASIDRSRSRSSIDRATHRDRDRDRRSIAPECREISPCSP